MPNRFIQLSCKYIGFGAALTEFGHFDDFAENYDLALERGLLLTGEDKEYFARRRVQWLGECLHRLSERPARVMDYGCGCGSTTHLFFDVLSADFVVGLDTSAKSLKLAKHRHASQQVEFWTINQYRPRPQFDLVYCNGVFHHIPPMQRAAALDCIWHSLRPGGIFAFWENNPWNPGTRLVMSRIPFDRDAVTLTSAEAHQLLHSAGFQVLQTDFLFVFPRMLKWFRRIEPWISALPLGAQFQVLSRKP
jgi:trans-aconitate methyltransferase